MRILEPDSAAVKQAAQALAGGMLVAFPTETVYGLGAAADNTDAIARLYAAKGRPNNHPVIVHLYSADQLDQWATGIPDAAWRLARTLWPGPLTLILPRSSAVSDAVTGGQDSVGLRIPNHPVALALLKEFGRGVAAPSANKFGRLSPTDAEAVAGEFADEVDIVLNGGPCEVGIESTIVDFSQEEPRILRPGMIQAQQIETVAGVQILAAALGRVTSGTRAPGGLPSHYAPRTPLKVVPSDQLTNTLHTLRSQNKKIGVLGFQPPEPGTAWIVAKLDAQHYARHLYANLRKLDQENADLILVEQVPAEPSWEGIADRLQRAAATNVDQQGSK